MYERRSVSIATIKRVLANMTRGPNANVLANVKTTLGSLNDSWNYGVTGSTADF